jgi:hypothetical protein
MKNQVAGKLLRINNSIFAEKKTDEGETTPVYSAATAKMSLPGEGIPPGPRKL